MRLRAAFGPALAGLLLSSSAVATPLSETAARMAPGTFAELTPMNGWDNGVILTTPDVSSCNPSDYITQYAEKAAWDPIGHRILFVGQSHGSCYGGRFVSYTDATNTWAEEPWLPGLCKSGSASNPCFNHGYDHSTVDLRDAPRSAAEPWA